MRRSSQSTAADRSWIERHPVWTGALVGFSAGFLLTYAVGDDDEHALLRPVDPGGPALVWGGLGAGLGALAGWGIGRNREKDDPTAPSILAITPVPSQ
jgi:hypothetical protein